MKIRLRESKDITIIDIEGRIDIDSAELIETVGWLLKNGKSKILCNFENVELVDYSGLSILAIAYKNVTNHNSIMKFCNVGLHVKELFKVIRLDEIFQCYNSEEEALENFDEKILEIESKLLRRRFKRLEININVNFTAKGAKKDRLFSGKVFNISGAGMFIYTHSILPVKTRLDLEISLPKEMAPLSMEGMVIWIADKNLQSYCYPGMGIQFINVDTQKQKELLEFIDKNITHRSEI